MRTLYRYIDYGRIPGYRIGRSIKLLESDVDSFISRSKIPSGSLGPGP